MKAVMGHVLLIVTLGAFLLCSAACGQTVVYVSKSGSDLNDGLSWGAAKLTVQAGLNAASSGWEVWVAAGTYVERITLKAGVALYGGFVGTETLRSQRNWRTNTTILDGNKGGDVVTSPSGATSTTRIDGFDIRNSGDNGGDGVFISSSSPTIANNVLRDNQCGIYWGGASSSPTIACNTIVGNEDAIEGSYGAPTITNNVVAGNGSGVRLNYCSGKMVNNTAVANGSSGLIFYSSNTIVANNVAAYNETGIYQIYYPGAGLSPTLRNNDVYNPGGVNYTGLSAGTGDISVDPKLEAAQYGRVHIQPDSPCRNAGSNADVVSGWPDMDGQTRIQATLVDIGADESDGSSWSFTATIVRVSPSGVDSNNGSSWALAKRTLQAGIYAASAVGGEVWVAAGTYNERIALLPFAYLYGGFAGTETERTQRDWTDNPTIADGGRGGSVVVVDGGRMCSTLDGFTIRNGSATDGAGIYCYNASPAIANCLVMSNVGDGIYCTRSNTTIVNNTIAGNSGSGVYAGGSALITNNTITGNSASTGGIRCNGSSPTITNNIVAGNSSGISSSGGSPVLRNNDVYNPGGYNYSGISAGTGDISLDPKLEAAQYGRLHIQPDSPCKNAGYDAAVQPGWLDMDGQARLQGTHVDIGADESDDTVWSFTPSVVRVSLSGNDANDGSSWALAKGTVQAGIGAASAVGGEVWVAAGTYNERVTLLSFAHAYGGFAGTEAAKTERDWTANPTILDGGAGGSVVSAILGHQCSTVDGLTIRNGSATNGGGVYCVNSSPTISNCAISGNIASSSGGGIYCDMSSPVVANNLISSNSAATNGGGIYCHTSSPTITGNTVVANSARYGGAVCNVIDSTLSLSNNVIALNTSGIYNSSATAVLRNNDVYNPAGYNYSGISAGIGDISLDPKLEAAHYGRFHIQPDSPCKDAGYDDAVQPGWLDMDGQPRVQGMHVDIGADESDGTVWSFTPSAVRVSLSGDDANDGSSWVLAKRTVQAGIDAASAIGGEVWVAAGTYNERITLRSFAHAYGGFAGTETAKSERNWTDNPTILDGAAGGSVVTATVGHQCSTIDGFTIRNGSATNGGGVYCSGSGPTISNCTISNNVASSKGGGIYCSVSSPAITSNTMVGNSAATSGGGIYCVNSSPAITDNTIDGNSAPSHGGGIYCSSSSLTIANNNINSNLSGYGGGLECSSSSADVRNNAIIGNCASREGGGIYCTSSSPAIVGNTLISNIAVIGGGMRCDNSSPTLTNNIVAANSSGIYNAGGTPVLRNNDVYNPISYNYSGLSAGSGDISLDPKIEAAQYDRFHIQPDSPCKDAGYDAAVQPGWVDIDGQARVQGSHVDIGADESDDTVWTFTPTIVRVSLSGNDSNDGSSWALAKRNVQAGIDAASAMGGEVWVAAGTYNERITLLAFAHVYGGFSGTETASTERDWINNLTILDGGDGGSVVTASGYGFAHATIDGFTIRNGSATNGAGISCSNSSPIVANCVIADNNAASSGGGIYCLNSVPLLSFTSITGNVAQNGGGAYLSYSSAAISSSSIVGNSASSSGGGIRCDESGAVLSGNTIAQNSASSSGGGVYVWLSILSAAPASILGNTIAFNTASTGGGIYTYRGTYANNIVAFNSSGIQRFSGTVNLRNNDVYNPAGSNYYNLTAGPGDISLDPLFLDGTGGDYHLASTSPCIDAGNNADAAVLDRDGLIRPQDGDCNGTATVDMGAYERPLNLGKAKRQYVDGNSIAFGGVSVTAALTGRIYAETTDRLSGVRVDTAENFALGTLVNISGTMQTDITTGECYIQATSPWPDPTGSYFTVEPLGLANPPIGGGAAGLQLGVAGGVGLNNIGLLVTVWGKVTQIGADYVYIDDGANLKDGTYTATEENIGVKVMCDPTGISSGEYLVVNGISSCFKTPGGQIARLILTRGLGDIRKIVH